MGKNAGIKIITKKKFDEEELLKQVRGVQNVTQCSLEDDILVYTLNDWASSYDVMVSIMQILDEGFGLDSEPYVSMSSEEDVIEEIDVENDIDEEKEENKIEEKPEKEEEEKEENIWYQIAKIVVSVICLILGLIFDSKGYKAAPYLYIISFAVAGHEIFYEAVVGFVKKNYFSETLLMTIASIAAFALGEMPEAIGILLLFTIGELFEDKATDNSRKVIEDLKALCGKEGTVLLEDGTEEIKPINEIEVGSILVVKVGERVPLDGEIIEGKTNIDEKALTGESLYRVCEVGSEVYEGSIVVDGLIKIRVTKDHEHSTYAKIMDIIESAEDRKAKSEKFLDKFSRWYTPSMMILAVLIAFIPPIFYSTYMTGLEIWGLRAVMILCISCPCSVVVSIPLAYYCGIGTAAKQGVIVKGSEYLDTLADCKTFVFDKTGTLTEGKFSISKVIAEDGNKDKLLEIVAAAESYSNHPLARAILDNYKKEINKELISDYTEIAGRGISLTYNKDQVLCGNEKLMTENGVKTKDNDDIGMKLYVAVNGKYAGIVILNDTVRSNAYGVINELYEYGVLDTIMLTGDNREYAKVVRQSLNMKKSYSELLPQDKVSKMEEILKDNHGGKVAYIGDGINDAPVIKRSDVGFAMGAMGSDAAIDSSDIVITNDDLSKVPFTFKLARRTKFIMMENIIASLSVKAIILILTISGLAANLWLAMAADVGMLILAIVNAIRNRMNIK